jgi:hypothetical protein
MKAFGFVALLHVAGKAKGSNDHKDDIFDAGIGQAPELRRLREIQLHDIAGMQCADGDDDSFLMSLNLPPAVRGQYQYRQLTSAEILLVAQIAVGRNERVEVRLRRSEQGAVVEFGQPIS